jgi:hypothetical protein
MKKGIRFAGKGATGNMWKVVHRGYEALELLMRKLHKTQQKKAASKAVSGGGGGGTAAVPGQPTLTSFYKVVFKNVRVAPCLFVRVGTFVTVVADAHTCTTHVSMHAHCCI